MIRILIYVLIIFALAAGFAWLADNPGSVTLQFREFEITTTVMATAILVVAVLVAARLLWIVVRSVVRAPRRIGRQMAERRQELGHNALTEGFIAVGSGDAGLASHFAAESRYYAPNDPLTLLLAAQTAQLTGDEMAVRAAFESMLAKPETLILGLRGLFLEARRRGDAEAAKSFAEAANREKPGTAWAGSALLDYQAAAHEWAEAGDTLANMVGAGSIGRDRAHRLRAVLQLARAMDVEDSDPATARDLALEAHRQVPELVPAAALAARLATRLGDVKRATKVLEAAWKTEPHPEIAAAYMDARPGESSRDRLRRMTHLTKIRANHPEGQIALAQAAIEAQDWETAREALRGLLAAQPTERVFRLMAEIEEGENGDIGRVRDWLNRALRAPRDPAWMADGYVFDHWEPVSPVTGRIDAFEWKVPAERMQVAGPAEDFGPEPSESKAVIISAKVASPDNPAERPAPAEIIPAEPPGVDHQPDDPGPEPDEEPAPATQPQSQRRRFKLFSSS